nr:putative ribonuclease H-like domain-containing protein [Tanacetum cinerariifolium]
MCDKKNSVLFIETKWFVLFPNFKLLDESQVLLRVPKQSNMYSFDLQNVVPSGDLTCLFSKASIDVSNLWHKRLGHVNFKTMNKLVKGNLVRGLPLKIFENDHTCVACYKGKQHKAICKAKLVSSISQSLQILNMNLFGPTSVMSINQKKYCLVVTDDFSRFRWMFFLASKDETGPQDTNGNADDKAIDDKPMDDTGLKTVKEPVNKEDQAYKNKLNRLMSQEKEASDAADALRQECEQGCIDQRGVTNSGSTNSFNTISHLVNADGPSSPYHDAFILANILLHVDQDDS